MYQSVCQSCFLFGCLFVVCVCLIVCLSTCLSIYFFIFLSIYLIIRPSFCLSICLSISLLIYLPICLLLCWVVLGSSTSSQLFPRGSLPVISWNICPDDGSARLFWHGAARPLTFSTAFHSRNRNSPFAAPLPISPLQPPTHLCTLTPHKSFSSTSSARLDLSTLDCTYLRYSRRLFHSPKHVVFTLSEMPKVHSSASGLGVREKWVPAWVSQAEWGGGRVPLRAVPRWVRKLGEVDWSQVSRQKKLGKSKNVWTHVEKQGIYFLWERLAQ